MSFRKQVEEVQERIERTCQRCGRDSREVQLIGVSKYLDIDQTRALMKAGVKHLGENRVQAAVPKWEALHHLGGVWHFIGHLQRNKAKEVVGRFSYIHSLDNLSLALELDKRAAALGHSVSCFVQVNVSGERSKYGLEPKNLLGFVEKLGNLHYIQVVGLMTMAPRVERPEEARPYFRELADWQKKVQSLHIAYAPAEHLSMGMSGDFEVAIEEGATFVRVGRVLVGHMPSTGQIKDQGNEG